MPGIALNTATSIEQRQSAYWPPAVAWLAVIAHFCVADVVGVNSRSSKHDFAVVRDAAVLLAQADLIVIWLVLGSSRWIRRFPWSLCGLSGLGLVLYMHNFNDVMGVVLAAYVAHGLTTAAVVGFLRFRGKRIENLARNEPTEETERSRRQFTILDLFGAALAVAIAVSWVLRMEPPTAVRGDAGVFAMLAVVVAPLSAFTLTAAVGMQCQRWLVIQIIFAAFIAIFLTNTLGHEIGQQLCLSYSVHWFLVAATLWVFQMCGYRLVRTTLPM
ncbi:MAG: hypothetical protein WD894_19540 [Pirellulales bacterium]